MRNPLGGGGGGWVSEEFREVLGLLSLNNDNALWHKLHPRGEDHVCQDRVATRLAGIKQA